jgi:hypothetical protein
MSSSTENSGDNSGNANIAAHKFKPGQSGNPGGRPKKQPITDYLIDQLDRPIPELMREKVPQIFVEVYGSNATFGQLLAFKLITQAVKGDMQAAKEVLDRVEGKVKQSVAMSGDGGGPIQFVVTRAGSKEGYGR